MFKLIALFLATVLVAVTSGVILGGYSDRPELLKDPNVEALTKYAAEYLAMKQNLILDHIKITGVQTQIVAGINYKIDFTGESVNEKITTCQVIIYARFDSTKRITDAQCHTE